MIEKPIVPRGFHIKENDISVCAATKTTRRKTEVIQKYKLERGCECLTCKWSGVFTAEMLAFDHIDPNSKNPRLRKNIGMAGLSWDDLVSEISKCRVICHNCHFKHSIENNHQRSKRKQ